MGIISNGIVYKNPHAYAGAISKVVRLANGETVVAFRESIWRGEFRTHADPTTRTSLVRSSDGETWHTVVTPDPAGGNGAAMNQLSDGTLIVNATHWRWVPIDRKGELGNPHLSRELNELGIAGAPTGVFITRSTNDGYNWDAPRIVKTPGMGVSVSHGPVIELADGSLLVPLEGVETDAREKKVWVNRSTDGGETWRFHGTVADSKDEIGFHELRLLLLPSGRILATMRTQEANFYQAHSDDGGST